ncbi:Protein kinase-like domain [Phytophthora cactorum]|nr:Protein kinase-like domain [Phytophthora cactorum]
MPSGSMPTASHSTFEDEADQWQHLRHPNVIKMYGACTAGPNLQFFVCEYASQGSLREHTDPARITKSTMWKLLHEAVLGLEYLHERGIIHGDLRCSNILVGSDGMAKLSNLRLSGSTSVASSRWQSPEVLEGNPPSQQSMCILLEYALFRLKLERDHDTGIVKVMPEQVKSGGHRRRVINGMNLNALEETPVTYSFDAYAFGRMKELWLKVLAHMEKCEQIQYHQEFDKLKKICERLQDSVHGQALFGRFHTLLIEYYQMIRMSPEQARIMRLSSTRVTNNSLYAFQWRVNSLMASLGEAPEAEKKREERWHEQRKDQIEGFVTGVSDTFLLLKDLKSLEERSLFLKNLKSELEDPQGNYTADQRAVMEKVHKEIARMLEREGDSDLWLDSQVMVKRLDLAGSSTNFDTSISDFSLSTLSVLADPTVSEAAVKSTKREEALKMFRREVDIWFGFSHPHVIQLFGACHVGRPFFVCEYATNGTLVSYLRKNPDRLWTKLHEAALGIQYLHARGVVHGDLKGNNIVIGSDMKAKVTDFV